MPHVLTVVMKSVISMQPLCPSSQSPNPFPRPLNTIPKTAADNLAQQCQLAQVLLHDYYNFLAITFFNRLWLLLILNLRNYILFYHDRFCLSTSKHAIFSTPQPLALGSHVKSEEEWCGFEFCPIWTF